MVLPRKFFPNSLFKTVKKMSRKMHDFRLMSRAAKSPIFSLVAFAVIFFIVYADTRSRLPNLSISSANLRTEKIFPTTLNLKTNDQLQPSHSSIPQDFKQENTDEAEEAVDSLIPPVNVTTDVRMEWFRRKLPELEIFNSNSLSQKFHGRVLEFFNNECTVHFFMIWLSPARTFGPRQFLALDSLFKTNPQACLIILSRSMDTKHGYRILKPLLDLRFKILAVTPDLPFLVKNTPAEVWLDEMKSGTKDPGHHPLSVNLSNLMRLAVLYKYGGFYMDTDFIFLKDFAGLRNVIGAQSLDPVTKQWSRINNAVLIFDMNHPLLAEFLRGFATTYDGNKWGHNGPALVSKVIEGIGNSSDYNFTVLQPQAFYAVNWLKIGRFFAKPANATESARLEKQLHSLTSSYALHLWNKKTKELAIEDGSAMDRLISDHCVVCPNKNQ